LSLEEVIIKEIFSNEEIKRLFKACDQYPQALATWNKAIVKFLLDTGVRASELCELTADRIDERMRRVDVTGKGMKDRYVVVSESTGQALWKYINFFRRPERGMKTGRVFLTYKGTALKPAELERMLRNLGERAQVEHVHPHRFRHTAGTLFYRNSNGNLFLTQQMLGHESPVTTRIYAKTYTEDLERVHENASPVSNWEL
jgi:integrase/recombinase XerD